MSILEEFIKKASTAGVLLIFVTILALMLQNSGLSAAYSSFLHTHVEIRSAICKSPSPGFTMSLFIDSLAFNDTQIYHFSDKLAILLDSFLSGAVGYFVLKGSGKRG